MKTNKTLRNIVLALALGSTGCTRVNHFQYNYNGKIGEDQVTFTEKTYFLTDDDNILTITKPDGRVIRYMDAFNEDLKLEYVEITKNGQITRYTPKDEVGKSVLEKAQKQFDDYLQQIKISKTNQGLVDLE